MPGIRLVTFALILVATPAVSWGQAPSGAGGRQDNAIAKRHYQLGAEYYRAGRYADALEQFKKAHELTALPALVFNIARCHERLNQNREAIDHYERFLRTVKDPGKRAAIERRLTVLRAKAKAAPASPSSVAPAVEDNTSDPVQVQAPRPTLVARTSEPAGWKRTTGGVALGLGAATIVTGIVLGAMASAKGEEHAEAVKDGKTYEELEGIKDTGTRLEAAQIATLVVGGVVTAVGGGLLVWHYFFPSPRRTVGVLPVVAGDRVGLLGQFRF